MEAKVKIKVKVEGLPCSKSKSAQVSRKDFQGMIFCVCKDVIVTAHLQIISCIV